MISKAEAASWSRYIDDKVQSSVETGSSFALAFTAFLSVFREGAGVVLFYQPMLNEGNPSMVWAGFATGCVLLVFVYLAITKLSIRLPINVIQIFGIYPWLETLVPQLILGIVLLVTFLIAHYRGKMDALRAELTAKNGPKEA